MIEHSVKNKEVAGYLLGKRGLGKEEIVALARLIGNFETSILSYEDCCTVCIPPHPLTRPHFKSIQASFVSLRIERILKKALEGMRTKDV